MKIAMQEKFMEKMDILPEYRQQEVLDFRILSNFWETP